VFRRKGGGSAEKGCGRRCFVPECPKPIHGGAEKGGNYLRKKKGGNPEASSRPPEEEGGSLSRYLLSWSVRKGPKKGDPRSAIPFLLLFLGRASQKVEKGGQMRHVLAVERRGGEKKERRFPLPYSSAICWEGEGGKGHIRREATERPSVPHVQIKKAEGRGGSAGRRSISFLSPVGGQLFIGGGGDLRKKGRERGGGGRTASHQRSDSNWSALHS